MVHEGTQRSDRSFCLRKSESVTKGRTHDECGGMSWNLQRGRQELQKERTAHVKTVKGGDGSRGSIGWGSGVVDKAVLLWAALLKAPRESKIQLFAMVFSIHRDAICWPHFVPAGAGQPR